MLESIDDKFYLQVKKQQEYEASGIKQSSLLSRLRKSIEGDVEYLIQYQVPEFIYKYQKNLYKQGEFSHLNCAHYTQTQHNLLTPVSSWELVQERVYEDPWKVFMVCLFLKRTSIRQVWKIIWYFFQECPSPQSAIDYDTEKLQDMIRQLGFVNRRSEQIKAISYEYIHKDWKHPQDIKFVGKYASDAYFMFCCKDMWRYLKPEDKELKKYHQFLTDTDGLGYASEKLPMLYGRMEYVVQTLPTYFEECPSDDEPCLPVEIE